MLGLMGIFPAIVDGQSDRRTADRSDSIDCTIEIDVNLQTTTIISGKIYKPFYAIPSGCALVVLDDKVLTESRLDDGSELNLMDKGIYEELNHLIDENINWRINRYGSKAPHEMKELD
jgi:hypothetical protein